MKTDEIVTSYYKGKKYLVSRHGEIYDVTTRQNISSDFSNYSRRHMVVATFFGYAPFKVKVYSKAIDIRYLEYEFDKCIRINATMYMIDGVRFIQIQDFPNYYVNEYGLIYSKNSKRFIMHLITPYGYRAVSITDAFGIRRQTQVHRIVYYAHKQIIDPHELQINHKDGNPCNNYYLNLEELTPLENTRYSMFVLNTRSNSWEPSEIEYICDQMANKQKLPLAIYNDLRVRGKQVTLPQIKELCHHLSRKTKFWKDISSKYDFTAYLEERRPVSDAVVHQICADLEAGGRPVELSNKYGVSFKFISALKQQKTRQKISLQYNMPLNDYRKDRVKS